MEALQWMCYLHLGIQAMEGFEMIHWSGHLKMLSNYLYLLPCSLFATTTNYVKLLLNAD